MPTHRTPHHRHLVAGRQHVRHTRCQPDALLLPIAAPTDPLLSQQHAGILREVLDVFMALVDGVPFRLQFHHVAKRFPHFIKRVIHLLDKVAEMKLLPEIVAGKGNRATGMLLLRVTQQVGGETYLGLHLLLAVTEIIVGDQRDHHPGGVPASHLESTTVVIPFLLRLPAHAVPFLPVCGLRNMRQAKLLFAKRYQVRGEHHATGVPGPMFRVERGIVFRQVRITGVAENGLHEIQVGHEAARHKKPRLKRPLWANALNSRHHHRPQQQRDKQPRPVLLRACERDFHHRVRRGQRLAKQRGKHPLWHLLFVVRNRQPPLHDVKHPLGRAPVAPRIMQHALLDPVRVQAVRRIGIAVGRQRQGTGQAVVFQLQGVGRKAGNLTTAAFESPVQERLDSRIGRAMVLRQQAVFLPQVCEKMLAGFQQGKLAFLADDRLAAKPQLGVDHFRHATPAGVGVQVYAKSQPLFQFLCVIQIHLKRKDIILSQSKKSGQNRRAFVVDPWPVTGYAAAMSNDERLVNIESDLTHLEQLVESLNQTIIEQDKVIQQLQAQISRLTAGLESKEMDAIKGNITKPPHYQ